MGDEEVPSSAAAVAANQRVMEGVEQLKLAPGGDKTKPDQSKQKRQGKKGGENLKVTLDVEKKSKQGGSKVDKQSQASKVKELEGLPSTPQQNGEGPVTPQVLSLDDLAEQELLLPDYICPSSEDKSRQAAVREWIERSSFPWALRTVPLL